MPQIALNVELPAGDTPPSSVPMIPAGPEVVGRDGRRWLWDSIAHASVLELFRARNQQLPIDWEHATQHRAPKGEEAPAAGWITGLSINQGELVADVTWNERGGEQVTKREYRYISPVFDYDNTTRRIVRLVSAGLTNLANLHLPALNQEEDPMKLSTAIVAALGIAADATEEAAVAAIAQLKTAANREQSPKLDQYVPRADYDTLLTRATNAENSLAERDKTAHQAAVDAAISGALKDGKITPATESYHRASCSDQAGLERFRAFVGAAPVVADDTDLDKRKQVDTSLNAEQIAEKARAFVNTQAAAGIVVSTSAAVRHVLAGAK
jgi:phage I-like protein